MRGSGFTVKRKGASGAAALKGGLLPLAPASASATPTHLPAGAEKSSTIGRALAEGRARLLAAGVENPGLDASLFLAELLGIGRSGLFPAEDRPLAEPVRVRFNALIERRAAGECAAYILGRREFWGLDFTVGPAVLVPRPDTETLVEAALEALTALERPGEAPAVLDLCTGSGAVAIALKHERPSLQLYGSDISPEALAIAGINAAKLLPGEEIRFFTGDLFRALPPRPPRFALITANPPYVPSGDMAGLSREVRGEPSIALDGGGDGLDLIRRIIAGARDHLRPEGLLLMEADPRQIEAVTGILKAGGYGDIVVRRDLAGRDRVIGAYI